MVGRSAQSALVATATSWSLPIHLLCSLINKHGGKAPTTYLKLSSLDSKIRKPESYCMLL